MILGLFSGYTVHALTIRKERILVSIAKHAEDVHQAIADRQAAIKEASAEIAALNTIKI